MPRSDQYVYIPVPVKKGSKLLAHLKAESAQAIPSKRQSVLGPYLAALLEDRDDALYGEKDEGMWFSNNAPRIQSMVTGIVQEVLKSIPQSDWHISARPVERTAFVTEATDEEKDQEGQEMAAMFQDED